VPADSASGTDFLLSNCSDNSADARGEREIVLTFSQY
jgi:hypothetical protein